MQDTDLDARSGAHSLHLPQASSAPDPNLCDREPIHVPGSIQPHGFALVIDPVTLAVLAGAGDVAGRLSREWLGRPAGELLGTDIAEQLAGFGREEKESSFLGQVRTVRETFDVSAHFTGGVVFVELEPAGLSAASAVNVLAALDAASSSFEKAADIADLCARAAIVFRQLTGYDRAMVYRFLEDGTGVVVAEDVADGMDGFLNHHFPATDIPRQARALYVRNRIRVIPDVHYAPAPLMPGGAWRDLDLSDSALRSVSPLHVQYLKNMGVGASASVSIVKDGELWGLIACHNREPRRISYDARMACKAMAGALARQIRAREDALHYRERLRLRGTEDGLLARFSPDMSLVQFLSEAAPHLREALDADGLGLIEGETVVACGVTPPEDFMRGLARWILTRPAMPPIAAHQLSGIYPPAELEPAASGLLACVLPGETPIVLMWLRSEKIETVNWAGNPHKPGMEPGEPLTPRASFEAWSQTVRGQARPWSQNEIECVGRIRRTLLEVRQNRRLRELNRELSATINEKEALLEQKDYLLREVNHRVQNSLQLVSAFLGMQSREAKNESLTESLREAQRRLSAVALVHRRLYTDGQIQRIDLARYIEELSGELSVSLGPDWARRLSLDLAPVTIATDRAVNVGLILTELVINATKYAYGGQTGPLAITLEQSGGQFRLCVADKGIGKTGTRQGFGTRILKALIERLSGTVHESDNQPGLRVMVTAPLDVD